MAHDRFSVKYLSFEARVLFFVLVISAAVRLLLVLHGGANYYPDERRFTRCHDLYETVMKGRDELLCPTIQADHLGFTFVGMGPYLAVRAYEYAGRPNTIWPAPFLLSLCSVASILLVYGIALRLGASRAESLAAALLMAGSNILFYYSRHLLPYDASMAIALLGLWLGLKRDQNPVLLLVCGVLVVFSFMTYNGYYVFSGVAGLICLFTEGVEWRRLLRRGVLLAIGGMIPLLLAETAFQGFCDRSYLAELLSFGQTSLQGDHSEGWILPWVAFWYSEHALLVAWLVSIPAAMWFFLRSGDASERRRILVFLLAVAGIYAVFILRVSIMEAEVINARRSRQLVPFLCLLAGYAVTRITAEVSRRAAVRAGLSLLLVLQAGYNFFNAYNVMFPTEARRYVEETYGVDYVPVASFNLRGLPTPFPADTAENLPRYLLVNPFHLQIRGPYRVPDGRVVFSRRHPLQFEPYLYEGCTPEERVLFRNTDMSVRLIDTAPESE